MPRLQDAVPGDPQRTWQRHPNPVLIDPLHLAPESTDARSWFCVESERLRGGPNSSLTQTKLSEHETNRGEAEKSECVSGEIFEILGQAATAIEPREGALDNP